MKSRTMARAFGRVLRATRIAQGLTQEALAAEAAMDRTYPSLLEHGKREPTLDVFLRLANALHCPPTELLAATLGVAQRTPSDRPAEGGVNPPAASARGRSADTAAPPPQRPRWRREAA